MTPLSYLSAEGTRAAAIVPLTWYLLLVSCAVVLIIMSLLVVGVWRRRQQVADADLPEAPVVRGGNGLRWINWGLILSAPPLAVALVWTMAALAQTAGPPARPDLVIDVTGRQWWWQVDYAGNARSAPVATANEIHIPVGRKVLVRLHSNNVIHSFWVPQLTGKTDLIPGQTNLAWLAADRPGRFWGQCAEYCGLEHAKMAIEVVAEPSGTFDQWRIDQARPASAINAGSSVAAGEGLFRARCGRCHTVRGVVRAARPIAPDLTHLMSRARIAAGMLPNTRGARAGWIQNPQQVKPGARMPNQHLSSAQLNAVNAYLETLR